MLNSPPKPRRRWFSYSLRTMFVVVTVFAIWLGWELSYIRERKDAIARLGEPECLFIASTGELRNMNPGNEALIATIPIWRRWLGDEPMAQVCLDAAQDSSLVEKLVELFPEADLYGMTRSEPPENGVVHPPRIKWQKKSHRRLSRFAFE
jgi:hypothetical protein